MTQWAATLEQVRKEEAEQGYFDESSGDESVNEETKEEREERYGTFDTFVCLKLHYGAVT